MLAHLIRSLRETFVGDILIIQQANALIFPDAHRKIFFGEIQLPDLGTGILPLGYFRKQQWILYRPDQTARYRI